MLAARKLGPAAEASFLDGTFLADRRTTVRWASGGAGRCLIGACATHPDTLCGEGSSPRFGTVGISHVLAMPPCRHIRDLCAGSTWRRTQGSCRSCRRLNLRRGTAAEWRHTCLGAECNAAGAAADVPSVSCDAKAARSGSFRLSQHLEVGIEGIKITCIRNPCSCAGHDPHSQLPAPASGRKLPTTADCAAVLHVDWCTVGALPQPFSTETSREVDNLQHLCSVRICLARHALYWSSQRS